MSEKEFAGKSVFITGSAQGIGLATAKILASRGANVALADLQPAAVKKAAEEIAKEYGVRTLPLPLDVTKPDQVEKAIAQVVKEFGKLDYAVNAAGIPGVRGVGAKFNEYPLDDWNLVMDVNCNGVFYSCLYESKEMLKAGKGSIVNIASTAGLIAYPTQGIRSSFSKLTASGVHCQQACSHRNHQVCGHRTRRVGHSHQRNSPRIYRDNIVESACKRRCRLPNDGCLSSAEAPRPSRGNGRTCRVPPFRPGVLLQWRHICQRRCSSCGITRRLSMDLEDM